MRIVLALAVTAMSLSAAAADLTLERIFGDPNLAGSAPRALKVSPDGRRVGFLRGRADDQHQLDFWSFDIRDHTLARRIDSKRLLPSEALSDAEKARRERARIADWHGIVGYDWAPDGRHVLFALGGGLYLYDLEAPPAAALRQLVHGGSAVLDAQLSPLGRFVSFVRDQDLWVIELATGTERRLTSDGGGTVHNAEAEFVAQEELHQPSGYWWAPDDSAIAFKRFDEAAVPVVRRMEVYADRVDTIEQRYPAAGDPNVAVRLGIVAPAGGAARFVDLGGDPDIYLARVDWTPDAKALAFQRLARRQRQLDLVLVDVTTLGERALLSETASTWVEVHDDLRFLAGVRAFIWSSDRSGTRHLYRYALDGTLERPLTAGEWNVGALLAVDEPAGFAYFSSNKDAAGDQQVYRVRLDGGDASTPERISRGDGWHEAQFPAHAKRIALYVDTFSDPSTPPQVSVNGPDGARLAWIEENALDAHHPYAPYLDRHVRPEFGSLLAEDGQALHYEVLKPPGFDPVRRYPVFLQVYGGPTVQTVHRAWPGFISEYMAQQGYVVFMLDNRGSARRGRRFQDPIAGRLGEVEVRDQLVGIRWLREQTWVDPARVGVFGWSYGGYMALMLLGKASDLIAAGVAVAPVTDWGLYDSCYTERYLGLPKENPAGYAASSVFAVLDGLKSPLLLAHGMADDNVLFTNSTRLMSELQSRGVQFDLMTYPGAKHGLSTPQMKVHVYTAIRRFFDRHLKAKD
jgi:dipeptidyl-peptidase-4